MSARRGLPIREKLVCALLVLTVPLGSLMNLTGVTTSEHEVIIAVLLVGLPFALPGGRLRTTGIRALAVSAFVACTVVSYLRFAAAPLGTIGARTMIGLAIMLTLVTAFALCALLAPADALTRQRRLICALFSPVCFVALNVVLYFVGFRFSTPRPETGSAQLLSLIGIHTTRTSLPLSPGLNGMGEAAALSLVICVALAARGQGRLRWVSMAGVPVSLTAILLTDSRGPLAYGVVALILLIVVPRWARRTVALIPLLLPVAPAIILFVLGQLGSLTESLNRNAGNGSFVTATGRSKIWSIVAQFLSHPHAEDLIGYGAYGQVRSGVGYQYAYLFSYDEHPEFSNVHNIALQTILDMGYLGLALFLFFLVVAVNSARVSYQRTATPESAALLAALIALSLFGASEALPGLTGINLLVSVIVLACAAIRVPPSARLRPRPATRARSPHLAANLPRMSTRPQTLAH
jgi:O-antigen ligase